MNIQLTNLIKLIQAQNFDHAEAVGENLLEKNPTDFNFNKLLGIAKLAKQKHSEALDKFLVAYQHNVGKKDIDLIINIASCHAELQDYADALQFSDLAISLNPQRPEPYQTIALVNIENYHFDEAQKNIEMSMELRGNDLDSLITLGDTLNLYLESLVAQNKKEEAIAFSQKILDHTLTKDFDYIARNIAFPQIVFRRLIDISVSSIKEEYISFIQEFLKKDNYPNKIVRGKMRATANMMLAEYFDKNKSGNPDEFFVSAKKELGIIQRIMPFVEQKKIKTIYKYFSQTEVINNIFNSVPGDRGEGLIFIVGMPRSGTTLLESMLSTCSDLYPGGEKKFFPRFINPELNFNLEKTDHRFFNELGDKFLKQISFSRKELHFFTDKLPGNYKNVGFIKLALPRAKFLHISRDPWDNAISLFRQFYVTNIMYASSFSDIGIEYANYEAIMKFWQSSPLMAKSILHITYEDLVSENDEIVNTIWQFLGLKGSYQSNNIADFFSKTASQSQVRQEVYKSSIKKKNFEEFYEVFNSELANQREYMANLLK